MGKLVMGYWDCPYCGTVGIEGTLQNCPYCAAGRGPKTKFYLKDEKVYLTEEQAKNKNKGADWLCSYCDTLNSNLDTTCTKCGADRESSSKNYFQLREEEMRKELERKQEDAKFKQNNMSSSNSEELKVANENDEYIVENTKSFQEKLIEKITSGGISRIFIIALFIFLFIGSISLCKMIFSPKTVSLHVNEIEWTYEASVEKYKTLSESGWNLPQDARLIETKEEYKEDKPVIDHYETKTRTYTVREKVGSHTETSYEDNGDGTFEEIKKEIDDYADVEKEEEYEEPVYRYEPIYATKYYYEVDKWCYEKTLTSSGNTHDTYWNDELNHLSDKERVASKNESYSIKATDKKGNEKRYTISKDMWLEINPDTDVEVVVQFGQIISFTN